MEFTISVIIKFAIYGILILVMGWLIMTFIGPKLFGIFDFAENVKIEYILPFFRNIYILKGRER